MRILHTADWHLGKIVHGVHMTNDQAHVLDQLLKIIKDEKPDCLIIAGDIYDRSIPPKEAVQLLDHVLTEIIVDFQIPILIISGNHDSPDRLQFGNRLFRENQLIIQTNISQSAETITLHDEDGPVHFHLIPYIEPADARAYFGDETINSHEQAMEKIVEEIKQHADMKERNVIVGHAFLAGGMESESEERLSMIGGSPYIDSQLFKDFSYVALGHLHQRQKVNFDHIQYSGSILKYSFSEEKHIKSVQMVELTKDELQIKRIPLDPKYDMRIIEGYFQEILTSETYPASDDYLHIRLLDDGQLIDPIGKLRKKFPNTLRLERAVLQGTKKLDDLQRMKERQQMNHEQLFSSFYEELKGETLPPSRAAYINQIIDQLTRKERGK
ncbi:exonuclease SbcCD subunit D [Paraliobacillus salinarum]|uniref:exonuclease SbcCD subunit D n=1 Tax=Paraliobacillus salinarum TaxID=1158996 RepID=UPI0015F4790B|nr:exonuclease SbcCD subunit D [Paraliobacillus salinarum]